MARRFGGMLASMISAVAGLMSLRVLASCPSFTSALTASLAAWGGASPGLWSVYDQQLKGAKYVDLTHFIAPAIPAWAGFGRSTFAPVLNPESGKPCTYARDGFKATAYALATDQLGTQLDPPAHWDPNYPAIDELPPTYAMRPLVGISIVPQLARNPAYALQVDDLLR
jgi:Putative cyclase